jgi:hypothetical protein
LESVERTIFAVKEALDEKGTLLRAFNHPANHAPPAGDASGLVVIRSPLGRRGGVNKKKKKKRRPVRQLQVIF